MNEFEKINLDDYVQTGEGGTSTSYTHKTRNAVIRLYKPGTEADRVKEDFLTSRTVFDLGVPSPEPYRLVTDGERFGAEYELIKNKRSYSRIISEEPERLKELSVLFAQKAKELHSIKADTTRLRSAKDIMRRFYTEKNVVPEFYKIKVLNFLEKIPDKPNCLHGDLQISNLITDGKRTLWIDLGDFSYGVPEWDLSWGGGMFAHIDDNRADHLFHLKHEDLLAHWNIFLSSYLGTDDSQQIAEATKRLIPFYAIRLPYMIDMAQFRPLPMAAYEHYAHLFDD